MSRSLTLGNGNLLVCLDKHAQVRDLYFPYVGLENHVGGHYLHRVGVWVEGVLRWLDHPSWNIEISGDKDTFIGAVTAHNNELGITLDIADLVYNEKNIFLRRVTVHNERSSSREIKIFFSQEFEIYESHRGDTAYYDPISSSIIHYNGRRVFLVNGMYESGGFDDYTTGIFQIEGKEGSHKDAEDGILSKNPIEHGLTDSVIGFSLSVSGNDDAALYYWITVSETIQDARDLNNYVILKTPDHLLETTGDFWHAWTNQNSFSFHGLTPDTISLFKQSLYIVRVHTDNHGAIIASCDSDMLQNGRDTYSYMWPRDASYAALSLDMVGDTNVSRRFYEFCNDVITNHGYFMHKYRPDRSLGSSWHPWVRNGKTQLPIQEDETALVIHSLWEHYQASKDLEFIEEVYNSLIKKASLFMIDYRDQKTGLPKPSYDLWEEKYGTSTFTACTVYGALISAARFADLLGKQRGEKRYREAAEEIRTAILTHLYDPTTGNFHKMLNIDERGEFVYDHTIDMSSAYGLFAFGVLEPDDERLERFMENVSATLSVHTPIGGIIRYENDGYFKTSRDAESNPWIITTLWLAQYYIAKAKNETDLEKAKEIINWTQDRAGGAGALSEQFNPYTGEILSASPLTWSHAEFVITIMRYMDKIEMLGVSKKYNLVEQI